MPTTTKSADIKLIREYNAPLAAVWDAWTDPEQVGLWWGPRGFTITTHSRDLRSGGTWKYTMHGPDGVDYENYTKYIDVEKHKTLVYDHGATATTNALFKVTALFSEANGKTKIDMTMTFGTPEQAETSGKFIRKAGGDATWDRLAEYLEKKVNGKEKFIINRSFDTPIDNMYKMWSEKEHVANWAAPTGFTMKYIHSDLKEGGKSFYSMSDGKDVTMYGRCDYKEFHKPDRIVYTQQFCDEKENVTRHPMAATWPETMLTVVQLTEEGKDRTRVTLTWEPSGTCSKEEIETFINARDGMTQGWTGSFDKLEEYLEKH
ncbi:MAG: hypothetical protein C0469_13165 [Cyanobacteria bacterium DS2.3.42]|nr:hypothetical protein [Cyanobacteria bacterium DS2.3.42]